MTHRTTLCYLLLMAMALLASCSDADGYVDTLPADAKALAFVDLAEGNRQVVSLDSLLNAGGLNDIVESGIDVSQRVFFFETADGLFGFCAKVADDDRLDKAFQRLSADGQGARPFKDARFAVVAGQWLAGFTGEALHVVGPVTPAQMPTLRLRMAKWLAADSKKSVRESSLFQRLDTMAAPAAVVAEVKAMPQPMRMPLAMTLPTGIDQEKVMVAASLTSHDGVLAMEGETFSPDAKVDEALKAADGAFKRVEGRFLPLVGVGTMAFFSTRTEGSRLLDAMKADKDCQAMLAGANMAIDVDAILKCVDGDVLCTVGKDGSQTTISLLAQLRSEDFLRDVDYWMSSSPKGTRMERVADKVYRFFDGKTTYRFGVTADGDFFLSGDAATLLPDDDGEKPSTPEMTMARECRYCLCLNLGLLADDPDYGGLVETFVRPVFGNARAWLFHLKN